jgi:F-type H+-transporting ATPase subunit delta
MKVTRRTRRSARQLFRLSMVDGRVDEGRVRQVARGIAASKRRGAIPVLSDFLRMVRLDRNRRLASVETATPLAEDVRNDVRAGLARLYGPGLETSFAQNPGLIGGMRISVGSDVYDGSVRAKLAAIEARL